MPQGARSPGQRLIFGTLYPAYSSYKAVKTKNVKEYVKWMMYWIVFAFFTTAETLTDIILSWFPFYFELKIAFVIWLLSPYTKGSSVLYRKFVHPTLSSKEKEIDEYISQAKDRSYETMMRFGKRGLNLAANAAVTAAAKGQGVLSDKLRSFSMQDLTLLRDEDTIHLRSTDPRMRTSFGNIPEMINDPGSQKERQGPATQSRAAPRFSNAYLKVILEAVRERPSADKAKRVHNTWEGFYTIRGVPHLHIKKRAMEIARVVLQEKVEEGEMERVKRCTHNDTRWLPSGEEVGSTQAQKSDGEQPEMKPEQLDEDVEKVPKRTQSLKAPKQKLQRSEVSCHDC
ncbi:receptor expression-enhancing protein 2-like [Carcharodon carcharias]|uniref:receptor expression-enhancing protein 2-like n=1 Tax=Carcharodon carcharias TaxID=13397 RepID=UPI001B7EB757|nr:receptor expression-enhancing protein 2-like [Carcharodon carcharias]